jgi:hypothetical protein
VALQTRALTGRTVRAHPCRCAEGRGQSRGGMRPHSLARAALLLPVVLWMLATTMPLAQAQCPGACQNIVNTCAAGYQNGLCPGSSQFQCCPSPANVNCIGQCLDISLSCSTGYVAGMCPGGANVQCCQHLCLSSPCQNGATCVETSSTSFRCDCVPGYSGARCTTDMNECASNPCRTFLAPCVVPGSLPSPVAHPPLHCSAL